MTWHSFHRRGEILRNVIAAVDARRDGQLPMDLEGVAETFGDETSLIGALQLRWHTRLSGQIERELMDQPMDLEHAVVVAWQRTADEMPGVRAVLDRYRAAPQDDAMAAVMTTSTAKERTMLAVMAGRASAQDAAAERVGAAIEDRARATRREAQAAAQTATNGTFVQRLKAALAA